MAKDKYRRSMPEPQLAHEMWSQEVCDRLDEVILLLKAQNATLVGDRAKSVQVEITEPSSEGSKADDKSQPKAEDKTPAKSAPASKPVSSSPPTGRAPVTKASAPAARPSTGTTTKK